MAVDPARCLELMPDQSRFAALDRSGLVGRHRGRGGDRLRGGGGTGPLSRGCGGTPAARSRRRGALGCIRQVRVVELLVIDHVVGVRVLRREERPQSLGAPLGFHRHHRLKHRVVVGERQPRVIGEVPIWPAVQANGQVCREACEDKFDVVGVRVEMAEREESGAVEALHADLGLDVNGPANKHHGQRPLVTRVGVLVGQVGVKSDIQSVGQVSDPLLGVVLEIIGRPLQGVVRQHVVLQEEGLAVLGREVLELLRPLGQLATKIGLDLGVLLPGQGLLQFAVAQHGRNEGG
mmetsp:Transcript_14866/g.39671  ORF Transcript_14866/g.39671 Transcript_14866/m.39671 type:complete len:292 (-) Transcript_14866:229-1104(-)